MTKIVEIAGFLYFCTRFTKLHIMSDDIRWEQRFNNYRKALGRLSQAVDIVQRQMEWDEDVDDLIKEGLIQRFEYTHELAWKVMKDYAEYQGYSDTKGSRDAFRRALEIGLISDSRWMESIIDRNQTSHLYDDDISGNIYQSILNVYFPLFQDFEKRMSLLLSKEHDTEPTLF